MTSLPCISGSRSPTGPRFGGWWPGAPGLVAESLAVVADPLRTGLVAGPAASGAEVARALARTLTPPEHDRAPPAWLLPGQTRSFRRALAALGRHGGALLADRVGSGKTYVALAVAAVLAPRRPTACLVPATLAPQWRDVATRLGVPVELGTHQQASRGRLPGVRHGLVIIDESHHFRNPDTCRYRHTAPWLVGRPVLLLSATPVVNRLDDLAHQLLLGVRDDALVADGVVSIRTGLAQGFAASALGRVVIEETAEAGPRPARSGSISAASDAEDRAAAFMLRRLDALRLSVHAPTAALVRGVLQRALASSPAALAGALRRYRGLLLHAEDARRAGRALGRAELRAFAGTLDDQLVLWELFESGGEPELALGDLHTIDAVTAEAVAAADGPDPKAERLRRLLADERPTLVFVTRRETVRHLRRRLAPRRVAWCTGERAGLGHATAPRGAVLDWFRHAGGAPAVSCLLATDVAAEGLDLRRAERVVHYDLPWTPMRLEQREGRAVRLGSTHTLVQVVRFTPPAALESALQLSRHLARKAALPGRAGLGAGGVRVWRWRSELADRLGDAPAIAGTALVRCQRGYAAQAGAVAGAGAGAGDNGGHAPHGLLAGFELVATREGRSERLAAVVGWLDPVGQWSEEEAVVTARLTDAAESVRVWPMTPARTSEALDRLAVPIRARLALAGSRRWVAAEPDPTARRLATRLGEAIQQAARRRDGPALTQLERALGFAAGGHTAGEDLLLRQLAVAPVDTVLRALARVPPPAARWDAVEARVTGLVLFEA